MRTSLWDTGKLRPMGGQRELGCSIDVRPKVYRIHVRRATGNKPSGQRQAEADRGRQRELGSMWIHWKGYLCRSPAHLCLQHGPGTSGFLQGMKVRQPASVCPCVGLRRGYKKQQPGQGHPILSAVPGCTGTACVKSCRIHTVAECWRELHPACTEH